MENEIILPEARRPTSRSSQSSSAHPAPPESPESPRDYLLSGTPPSQLCVSEQWTPHEVYRQAGVTRSQDDRTHSLSP